MMNVEMDVTTSEEVRPVDVLVELVKEKKIDPWEIDLVDLTEKYLDKIQEMTERNLRMSARTLLAASVLLRIKSDVVLSIERKYHDELEELEELEEMDEEASVDLLLAPQELPLGINIQRKVRRKVTLAELVDILDSVAMAPRESKRIKKIYARAVTKDLIRIDDLKKDIRGYIKRMYIDIKEKLTNTTSLSFSSIVSHADSLNKARMFLYLLFLAHQEKISIHQKAPFEEIFINLAEQPSTG